MKYIFIFTIPFVFFVSVFANESEGIFDDIANIDIASEEAMSLDDILDSGSENERVFNEKAEIYLDYKGGFFGVIKEGNFGIIFDNNESLVVSLDPIEDKTSSGIREAVITDKEKYVESLCIEKHRACEYTREGHRPTKELKISFFQKIKAFFYKVFLFFSSITTTEKEDITRVYEQMDTQEKEKLQGDTWTEFFEYRENKGGEGYGKEKSLEIRNNINKLVANADSLKDIMNLRALIDEYCYVEDKDKGYESAECKKLRARLKERGDGLKEKIFADIDEESKNALVKLMELRSILMAQEKASKGTTFTKDETDQWFSTENVAKINKGIREKAKKWWKKHLEEDCSIENIWQWRLLALAHETASGEYKNSSSIFGEYGGQLMKDVKEKAAAVVALNLIEIDICNPDLKKLEKLMDNLTYKDSESNLIYKDSCQLILSQAACDALRKKDIQKAYSLLFYDADLDENNPKSLPVPPIKCKKDIISTEEKSNTGVTNGVDDINKEADEKTVAKESEDICTLIIFEDETIGWDYIVENCTKNHNEGLVCWERCGVMPPLVIKDIEINECYETSDGYINRDLIIPCYYRPMPMDGIEDCIKECLIE